MAASIRERLALRFAWLARPREPEALPATLDRRRIYVLPTRFGLFFTLMCLAMALGALNYNNNPALLLALLLASTGLGSLMATHLQLSGLRVDALSAEPVPAGATMVVVLSLSARDNRLRHGLQLQRGTASTGIPPLSSNPVTASLHIETTRRGWLYPERIRISSTQPIGLARAWSWVWPEAPLLVYPVPETHGPPLPAGEGPAQQSRIHPAGDDIHHLRDYRSGDQQRTIAWKASARRDTLLVREHEQPLGQEILLDWHALHALPFEQRISRLAHWVDAAEREGRRYRLQLPGQPAIGPGQGAAHRHACLRALAVLPGEDGA